MCKYCNDEFSLVEVDFGLRRKMVVTIDKGEMCAWIDYDDLYYEEHIEIGYCPICGKDLKKPEDN